MSADLYEKSIVDAARRATGHGELVARTGASTVDNPLCGDRVSIEVIVDGGRLVEVAHRVRGCLLCEAAATTIAEHAHGRAAAELRKLPDELARALNGDAEFSWDALAMFRPVARVRSRHRCVLLPFEALAQALAGS